MFIKSAWGGNAKQVLDKKKIKDVCVEIHNFSE